MMWIRCEQHWQRVLPATVCSSRAFLNSGEVSVSALTLLVQEETKDIRAQMDHILHHMPRRPDASVEGYERMLEDMEAERSTTTMSLNAEKSLLREMEQVRARMRMVSEYEAADAEVKRLRALRDGISTQLDSLSAELDACSASLAVAQVLDRLLELRGDISGISAEDIVTIRVPIDAAAVPRIIGTKGETRRALEQRFAVIVDVDGGPGSRKGRDRSATSRGGPSRGGPSRGGPGRGTSAGGDASDATAEGQQPYVTIRGLADSVAEAREHVVDLCGTASATVPVSRGVQNLLLASSAKLLRELQDEHVVHLNIDRPGRRGERGGGGGRAAAKPAAGARASSGAPADELSAGSTVLVEGSERRVKQCVAALAALERTKQRVPLTTEQLIDIIGPGGERVRELQSKYDVVIETVRPTLDEASKGVSASSIDVYGADAAAVVRASAAVRDLAEELRRLDRQLRLESSFALFLLGNSAARLSKLRKTVQCQVELGPRVPASTLERARVLLAADEGADDDDDAGDDADSGDAEAAALFLPPDSDGVRATSRLFTVQARRDDLDAAVDALRALYAEFQAQRRRVVVPAAAARALVRNGAAGMRKVRADAPPGVLVMVDIDEDATGGGPGRGGSGGGRRGRVDADEFVLPPPGKAVVTIRMESGRSGAKSGSKGHRGKSAAIQAAAPAAAPAAGGGGDASSAAVGGTTDDASSAAAPVADSRSPAEKMEAAVEIVRAAVASFTERTVEIPDFAVPAILGRSGAVISKLQSDSGASVTLERGPIIKGSEPVAPKPKPVQAASAAATGAATAAGRRAGGRPARRGPAGGTSAGGRPARPARGPSTLHVSGQGEAVDKAIAAVDAIMETQQHAEVEGADDGDVRAAIIGERGASIKAIEASSGCKIDLDKARGVFIAIGRQEQVDKAAAEMRAAIEKHHRTNASLNVGPDMALSVIGKGGEAVRAMETEFKVRIRVDQHSGEISIRSDDEESLAAAVARIREQTGMDKPCVEVAYRRSKQDQVLPLVFGRQGSSLRRLQDEHGVVVAVDRKRCVLLVRGDEPSIEAAAEALRATVKDGSKTVVELFVPAAAVPGIIGRRGAAIRMLERLTRAGIDLRKGAVASGAVASGHPAANPAKQAKQAGRRGRGGLPSSRSAAPTAAHDPTDAKVTIRGRRAACQAAEAAVRAAAAGRAFAVLPLLPAMAARLLGDERTLLDRLASSGTHITLKGYVRGRRAAAAAAAAAITPAASSLVSSLWGAHGAKTGAADAPASSGGSAVKKGDEASAAPATRGSDNEDEDDDEDEDVGAPSAGCTVALTLVSGSEDAVREAQGAVEFSLGHRFTEQLARVPAPHGLLEALMDSTPQPQGRAIRITTASKAAAAGAVGADTGDADEDTARPASAESAPLSIESLRKVHGLSAVWTNTLTGHLLLCGDREAVAAARAVAEEAVTAYASLRGSVRVPEAIVPAIVGRAGARIKELQTETKCRLQMLRASDARAAGDAEVVAAAEAGCGLLRVTSADSETTLAGVAALKAEVARLAALRQAVRVPSGAAGAVLGHGGERIKAIGAESGARLRFNEERTAVNVSGDTAEQVADAVRLLREAMTESGIDPDQAEVPVEEVVVETNRNGAIAVIGRGGATVSRIQGDHRGVKVDIQADDGLVYIRGPKAAVEAAEAAVREVIAAADAEADARQDRREAERAANAESKGDDEAGGSRRGRDHGRGSGAGSGSGRGRGDSSSRDKAVATEPAPAPAPSAPHVPLGLGADWQEQMRARQVAENRARNSTRGPSVVHGTRSLTSADAARGGRKPKRAADLEAAAEADAVAAKAARDAASKPSAARKTAADEMLSILTSIPADAETAPAPAAAVAAPRRAPPPGLGFSPQPKRPVTSARTAPATDAPAPAPASTAALTSAPAPAAADDPFALLGLAAPATASVPRSSGAGATSAATSRQHDGIDDDGTSASFASMLSGGGITIRL